MRFRRADVIFIVLFAAMHASAQTGPRVRTEAQADSVTVGERLHVRYEATYADSLVLLPPGKLEMGKTRVVSLQWSERTEPGVRVKTADLTVMSLDLEGARVPAIPFHFLTPAGDTLTVRTRAVEVPVRQIAGDQSPPRPLKPQWEAPKSYARYWIIGAAVLLAAVIGFLVWRRFRRKRVVEPEAAPVLPADFVALRDLQAIERMNLLEAGEFKRHYTLVVDVLRHYMERRYGVLAMDRTSDELMDELTIRRVSIDGLELLLREADLVKFAKYKPDADAGRRALEKVRDIVVTTAPRPVAATAPEEVH